jgi:hypothetical protein
MTDLSALSREQLLALVATMQKAGERKITCKVSDKGGLSVYGLGRFPVTLYRSQWERLLAPETTKAIGAFIQANASLLAVKA